MSKHVPKDQLDKEFAALKAKPGNKICADCDTKAPNWASVPYGIFICMNCAATHRHLGTHLTFCRSTVLDSWTPAQLAAMKVGGNDRARAYFRKHGFAPGQADKQMLSVKYSSRPAQLYRKEIQDLIKGSSGTSSSSEGYLSSIKERAQKAQDEKQQRGGPVVSAGEAPAASRRHLQASKETAKVMSFKEDVAAKTGIGVKPAQTASFDDWNDWSEEEDDEVDEDDVGTPEAAETSIYSKGRPAVTGASSRLGYSDDSSSAYQPSIYTKRETAEEDKKEEILFSNEGFRLKRKPQEKKKAAQDARFQNSRAISSDDYFGTAHEAKDPETTARLANFSGASSISSADFYERDEGLGGGDSWEDDEDGDFAERIAATAKEDLERLTATIADVGGKLKDLGTAFFSSMGDSSYGGSW